MFAFRCTTPVNNSIDPSTPDAAAGLPPTRAGYRSALYSKDGSAISVAPFVSSGCSIRLQLSSEAEAMKATAS
jgi:hypothetical protein